MRSLLHFFTAMVVLTLPVTAGYYYEAVTKDDQGNSTTVQAWVTGPHAKIVFKESDNPIAQEGQYMVTSDGGRTMYLINDKEKTYTRFDIAAMMQLAGGIMNSLGGVVKMEFTDPDVQQLDKKPGGKFHGLATTYYKFQTKYDMTVKVIGIKKRHQIDSIVETWSTNKALDPGFGAWLRNEPPTTGNEDLDKMIEAQMRTVRGFPMKQVSVTTTRQVNKRGKVKDENTVRSTTEVTELRQENVSSSVSKIPDGYNEVEAISGDEEGSPFKNLFNRDDQD